jgi:hypothetical protein
MVEGGKDASEPVRQVKPRALRRRGTSNVERSTQRNPEAESDYGIRENHQARRVAESFRVMGHPIVPAFLSSRFA